MLPARECVCLASYQYKSMFFELHEPFEALCNRHPVESEASSACSRSLSCSLLF